MRFIAIDFETANSFRGSICAVGLAIVNNGVIEDSLIELVKPHTQYGYFHPINVSIHGITSKMVEEADEFDVVFEEIIKPIIKDQVVVAHNAAFDMSALRSVLDLYKIDYPEVEYICSCKAAQKTWEELPNHKLNTVAQFLDFEFQHHDAQEDALACANILIEVFKEKRAACFNELLPSIGMRAGRIFSSGYTPCSTSKNCLKAL